MCGSQKAPAQQPVAAPPPPPPPPAPPPAEAAPADTSAAATTDAYKRKGRSQLRSDLAIGGSISGTGINVP